MSMSDNDTAKLTVRFTGSKAASSVTIEQNGVQTKLSRCLDVTVSSASDENDDFPTATLTMFGDMETEILLSSDQASLVLLADKGAAIPLLTDDEVHALRLHHAYLARADALDRKFGDLDHLFSAMRKLIDALAERDGISAETH